MKNIRLLFLVVASLFGSHAFAVVYPSVEKVATKLYSNYSVPEYDYKEKLEYQKKRDGWHVAYAVYDTVLSDYVIKKEELFWSSSSGKYKELSLFQQGNTVGFANRVNKDLYWVSRYDYERCSYYGYDGWDKDVIADFGAIALSNDTLIEGLARAYSNFATGYLSAQQAFHNKDQMVPPESERVDLFITNEKKCIATYDQLRKRNPHFEVLVGEVTTKYANEIMSAYETLLYYKREGEMKSYFSEELYDPLMLGLARGMLESCEPNGLLFTNGDNDTFPLWYLQWFKNIRPDVAILNTSLLNLPAYINRFRNGFMRVSPVEMSLAPTVYEDRPNFYKGESSGEKAFYGTAFLSAGVYSQQVSGSSWTFFRTDKIIVHKPANLFKQYELLNETDSAVIRIKNSYLTSGEMALLDIVLTNYAHRPVYMATTATVPAYLSDYFYNEGVVKRFIPAQVDPGVESLTWMGPVASIKIFSEKLRKSYPADTSCSDRVNGNRWVLTYKTSAIYCAQVMMKGDTAGAIAILDDFYTRFPASRWKSDGMDYYSVVLYYQAGQVKSGDQLGILLLNEIEADLDKINQKPSLNQKQRDERSRSLTVLKMLKITFNEYRRPALGARAEKMSEKY